jgi:hypothetical protein
MKNKPMDKILISKRNARMLMDAELTDEQLGAVCRALLSYQSRGTLPAMDPVCMAFWKCIRADMKREFGEGVR